MSQFLGGGGWGRPVYFGWLTNENREVLDEYFLQTGDGICMLRAVLLDGGRSVGLVDCLF